MSERPDHIIEGGYPRDPDLPDYVRALYMSVKNTWQDAENLDDAHSYNTYIWIPEETFQVKIMKIRLYAEKFRAHSKSALDGGSAIITSEEKTPNHTHNVVIGADSSTYVTPDHTHDVVIGTKTSVAEHSHRHQMLAGAGAGTEPQQGQQYTYRPVSGATQAITIDADKNVDMYTWESIESHSHNVEIGTPTSEDGGGRHRHTIDYGTKTSAEGGGAHTHDVTIKDHTHGIEYGIYEEAITGRTLSAKLYDPNGVLIKDFGVLITGEDDDEIDLSDYFDELEYGMYKLVLEASGRLRARVVFYELSVMYAFT